MYKNKRSHRDANHSTIVKALRDAGYAVLEADKVDVICSKGKKAVFGEIKTVDGKFMLHQLKFLAEHPGYVATWKTEEEALLCMSNPDQFCFTEKQKARIMQIVLRYENKTTDNNPRIDCSVFEKEMSKF